MRPFIEPNPFIKRTNSKTEQKKSEVSTFQSKHTVEKSDAQTSRKSEESKTWFESLFSFLGNIFKSIWKFSVSVFEGPKQQFSPEFNSVSAFERPKQQFSPEFNSAFYNTVKNLINEEQNNNLSELQPVIIDNQNMIISQRLWRDLEGVELKLKDESNNIISIGQQSLLNFINKQLPHESQLKDLTDIEDKKEFEKTIENAKKEWKKEQVKILKNFFGYDENLPDNDEQNLRAKENLYLMSLNSGQALPAAFQDMSNPNSKNFSKAFPLQFEGSPFGYGAFTSKSEVFYTISKDENNNFILTCDQSITQIQYINSFKEGLAIPIETDPSKSSVELRFGLILSKDGNWLPYQEGFFSYDIVKAKE